VFVALEDPVFRVVPQPKVIIQICTAGLKWSIYEGESKIIRIVATYCAVGYTAGWA
jgi:hypothetical protein